MKIKIILAFSFILICNGNIVASDSGDNNYSCWKYLLACCINESSESNYDDVYIPLPNEQKIERAKYFTINQENRALLKNLPVKIKTPLSNNKGSEIK